MLPSSVASSMSAKSLSSSLSFRSADGERCRPRREGETEPERERRDVTDWEGFWMVRWRVDFGGCGDGEGVMFTRAISAGGLSISPFPVFLATATVSSSSFCEDAPLSYRLFSSLCKLLFPQWRGNHFPSMGLSVGRQAARIPRPTSTRVQTELLKVE